MFLLFKILLHPDILANTFTAIWADWLYKIFPKIWNQASLCHISDRVKLWRKIISKIPEFQDIH